MRILFLSLSRFESVKTRGIYSDLMRELIRRGNDVYIASPTERRFGKLTNLSKTPHCEILKIKTLNIQKTNIIEKGLGTLLLEYQFDRAIKKYWGMVKFDIILYATPPITFNKVIENIKKRTGARTYLMLKDIFPQNAVDLGMFSKSSLFYKLFRKKEKKLYNISDKIGCMSPANVRYVINNNPEVNPNKVEICPNAIETIDLPKLHQAQKDVTLVKYGIPHDKTVFVYGGNLGKPQGIDFLLKVIEANEKRTDSYIVVIGSGTEYPKIKHWFSERKLHNAKLMHALSKEDYDLFIRSCHIGLIFLDPRFTIPNFPSRLLSYLENSMPILLATDSNTDMGRIAEENGFGLWSLSGDIENFSSNMDKLTPDSIKEMGEKGHQFLLNNYTVDKVANKIIQ